MHGVKDLIVADASIIPFTVDGNVSAPAFLIGYTIARQLQLQDKKPQKRQGKRQPFENEEE
ncbi:choline dehydrogenase [compost metagenome]